MAAHSFGMLICAKGPGMTAERVKRDIREHLAKVLHARSAG